MKTKWFRIRERAVGLCWVALLAATAQAQTNYWNVPAGGWWETPGNWSFGTPPDATTPLIAITNAGTKTVRIYDGGPGPYSTVSNLLVSAPLATVNTLQLEWFESPNIFYEQPTGGKTATSLLTRLEKG